MREHATPLRARDPGAISAIFSGFPPAGIMVPRRGTELGIKAAEIRCNQQRDTAETIIETITKFGKGWTISEADFWLQIRSRSQSQLFKLAGRKIADRVIIL